MLSLSLCWCCCWCCCFCFLFNFRLERVRLRARSSWFFIFLFPRFQRVPVFFFSLTRGCRRAIRFSSSMFYIVVDFLLLSLALLALLSLSFTSADRQILPALPEVHRWAVFSTRTRYFVLSGVLSFFVDFHCCSVFYFVFFAAGSSYFLDGVSMLLCRWLNELVFIADQPLSPPSDTRTRRCWSSRMERGTYLSRTPAAEANTRD